MNTLWRKTWRDLWLNRARTVLVVAAIAVGTAATGVATTSLIVLRRDLRDGYAATNPAHAILDVTNMDEALAAEVAGLSEVSAAEARRQTQARLIVNKDDRPDGETRPLTLYTWPDFAGAAVGVLYDTSGSAPACAPAVDAPTPTLGRDNHTGLPLLCAPPEGELLLERSAAPALGLAVDDVVTVRGYWVDGDEVPAEEIQHLKANTDSNVRRGIPTTWPVHRFLKDAVLVLENIAATSQIQTSIGLIIRTEGATATGARALQTAE